MIHNMKYQLTCPKCKHEFSYDADYYEQNIVRLGKEIRDITLQLQKHKLLPWPEQKARTDWYFRTKKALTEKQKELGELKAVRRFADQQLDRMRIKILRNLMEEEIGPEAFWKLCERADKELEAYKVSGMMAHEYTRANYKTGAISINKLQKED